MKLDVKVASIDALDAVKARPHQIIQRPRGERDCLGGIENVGSVTLRSPLINQSVHMIYAKARPGSVSNLAVEQIRS